MPAAIDWTPELKARIAKLLINKPLIKVCEENPDLPSRASINERLAEDDEFWTQCARARRIHCFQRLENTQVKLDDALAKDHDQISIKLLEMQIGDARWNAERLLSKEYAPNQKHTGPDGEGPIAISLEIDSAYIPKNEDK